MLDRNPFEAERRQSGSVSNTPGPDATGETTALSKVARAREGERLASQDLLTAYFPGKHLFMGLPQPYQFVEIPGINHPGLRLPSCPCSEHQGHEGIHVLNPSEITLTLEWGPDRVWVFISIPARHRASYAWLPTIKMDSCVDAELCGVLVAGDASIRTREQSNVDRR